jgi:hypothetical protein
MRMPPGIKKGPGQDWTRAPAPLSAGAGPAMSASARLPCGRIRTSACTAPALGVKPYEIAKPLQAHRGRRETADNLTCEEAQPCRSETTYRPSPSDAISICLSRHDNSLNPPLAFAACSTRC